MSENELKDQEVRDLIQNDLDTTMLVEASAGTGKTEALTRRMISLVKNGKCKVDTLAAITFTKKAAAELRTRFQVSLEEAICGTTVEKECHNLRAALRDINDCYIGTIHSFCGSLLRERPIEAGVAFGFTEIDDIQDDWIRSMCWQDYCAGLYAANDNVLEQLDRIGMSLSLLQVSYEQLCRFSDIDNWPVPNVKLEDINTKTLAADFGAYIHHINNLNLPKEYGNDKLIPLYGDLLKAFRSTDTTDVVELMKLVDMSKEAGVVLKQWETNDIGRAERDGWAKFLEETIEPVRKKWHEYRYKKILPILKDARDHYEQQRKQSGQLNFNDLLIKAAKMLKENPNIREYFKRRYTHLLVDEFQDTDPVQAEIMLYLTATDTKEQNWTKCIPQSGSLFVVGDPKQSIYRFRRADIITYNAVKEIVRQNGEVLNLTTNFRSTPELIDWFNDTFSRKLPESNKYSPEYSGFSPYKDRDDTSTVMKCTVGNLDENIRYIASFIRQKVDDEGAAYGDIMVLTRNNQNLGSIATGLRGYGIECSVKNGCELNSSSEYQLLSVLLKAIVCQNDPVALVCLLRSPLAGFSDRLLYGYKKAGGYFNYSNSLENIDFEGVEVFREFFKRLERYRDWLFTMPCVSALKMIVGDVGLDLTTAMETTDRYVAERFQKILELSSAQQTDQWSVHDLLEWLESQDKLDMPVTEHRENSVQLLNIHNAKGLEAKHVFLGDIKGLLPSMKPWVHIDRTTSEELGYLAINVNKKILAAPPGWQEKQKEEIEFEKAEKKRLLYVAVTRAEISLAATIRAKSPQWNMWQELKDDIDDENTLPEPMGLSEISADGEKEIITADELAETESVIKKKWDYSLEHTFTAGSVKDITVTKKYGFGKRKHGAEWGELIHTLLERSIRNKDLDLIAISEFLIKGTPLSVEDAQEAVEHVKKVMESDIWVRAVKSKHCLTEVPYYVKQEHDGVDTIINGVVDLAFIADEKWVLVDYKTDTIEKDQLQDLVDNYSPQIQMYSDHWEQITDIEVSERGLYFTHLDDYITVNKSSSAVKL